MVAAIRLARERIGLPIIVPAVISWTFLFGYQWAFSLSYHGRLTMIEGNDGTVRSPTST